MEGSPKLKNFYRTTGFATNIYRKTFHSTSNNPFDPNKSLKPSDSDKLDLQKLFKTLETHSPENLSDIDWSHNIQMIPLGQPHRPSTKAREDKQEKQDIYYKTSQGDFYSHYVTFPTNPDLTDLREHTFYNSSQDRDISPQHHNFNMPSIPRSAVRTPALSNNPSAANLRSRSPQQAYSFYSGMNQRIGSATTVGMSQTQSRKTMFLTSKPKVSVEEIRKTAKGARKHRPSGSLSKLKPSKPEEGNKFFKPTRTSLGETGNVQRESVVRPKPPVKSIARVFNKFVNQTIMDEEVKKPIFSSHGSGLRIKKLPDLLFLKTDQK